MKPARFRLAVGVVLGFACTVPLLAQDAPNLLDSPPPQSNPPSAGSGPEPANESSIPALVRSADQAVRNRDYASCAQILEQVVAIDAKFNNALNYLGWAYNSLGQYAKAESVLRRAITVDPLDHQAYNNLGQALAAQKKYAEAIPQYQRQIQIRPRDPWAHANVGRVFFLTKQYPQALAELSIAAEITPDEPSIPFNIGRTYAKLDQPAEAARAYAKSAELQPTPPRWNSVAYQMAQDNIDLPRAQKYAQMAIAALSQQMREISLDHLTRDDAYKASRIASFWDTLGWVRFHQDELPEAEKYVKAAWQVHTLAIDADHLGQIYERLGRKLDAQRMYQMALATNANANVLANTNADELRSRLLALVGTGANLDSLIEQGKAFLKESQSVEISNSHAVEGFADFWILQSPGAVTRGVKFVTGDDELKPFEADLQKAAFPDVFPEATELELLRRVRLSCSKGATTCRLVFVSAQSTPTDEIPQSAPTTAGEIGRVRLEGSAATSKLVSSVQPVYPPLARQTRIQGVVKLHAIVATDGSVKQLEVISGHPLLLQAALDAVRQWKYEPMLVQGQAVEVDTTIDVFFALNK